MNYINTLIIGIIAVVLVLGYVNQGDSLGNATPDLQARLLVATTTSVGHQTDVTLFSEKTSCASRVISTFGTPIVLSFDSSVVNPSATNGHIQGASTTVAYDSGLYGCGAVVAASSATTTIATAEFVY